MVQRLGIRQTNRFRDRGQGFARQVGQQANVEQFKLFIAADIRKQLLVAATVLIHKGKGWRSGAWDRHNAGSVPDLTEEGYMNSD
jgi:hypothetical protein